MYCVPVKTQFSGIVQFCLLFFVISCPLSLMLLSTFEYKYKRTLPKLECSKSARASTDHYLL